MILFAVLLIAAEVTVLATGLLEHRRIPVTLAFVVSSVAALIEALIATHRLASLPGNQQAVSGLQIVLIGAAATTGVAGTFIAVWPGTS